jgi:hypothetical protein
MSKKPKIPFAEIARSITGISTPVFGVSWNPPKSKRDVVRRIVTYLEDRRALYEEQHMEYTPWVEESVLEIRKELTEVLKQCPEDETLTEPIRAMRAACREFLNAAGPHGGGRHYHPRDAEMWIALGRLRGVFGLHLARLCAAYGVDVEPDLATIFPTTNEDTEAFTEQNDDD